MNTRSRVRKHILIFLLVILLCGASASSLEGQEPPILPVKKSFLKKFGRVLAGPFTDKKLLAAMLVQGGAMAFDGYTTSHVIHVCSGCRETAVLLGTRPSDQRIAITLGAGWYLQALLVKWEKDRSLEFATESKNAWGRAFWNMLWSAHPTVLTIAHTRAGLHNQRVAQCPSGFSRANGVCKPK